MSTLTSRLVTRLGSSDPALSYWTNSKVKYDFAVGGVPLIAAPSPNNPYGRKTAPYRKDQVDQSDSPGEQSLVFWWLRSQLSFHAGAGIEYEEPTASRIEFAQGTVENRFAYSEGLDVFSNKGKATLLPRSINMDAGLGNPYTTRVYMMGATDANGVDVMFVGSSEDRGGTVSTVFRYDSQPNNGNSVFSSSGVVYWEAGGTTDPIIRSMTNDGTNYYIANAVGIYQGTLAGGNGTKIWNTGSSRVCLAWAKQRLVAGIGQKLYELTGISGAPTLPLDGATGHIYTHPNSNWTWTCFAETPQAILAAGYVGSQSVIYKMVLTAGDGSTPVIGDPVIIARMPTGELIYSITNVLDTFLAIGTNKGVRIATVDDNGNVQYGPLTVETPGIVYQMAVRGRMLYFTYTGGLENGDSCIGVIDMATQVDTGQWAYSTHLAIDNASSPNAPAGTVYGVAVVGASGRLAFAVDDAGLTDVWMESDGELTPSGKLRTGKIRFHTLEPKLFKFLKVRATSLVGSIAAEYSASDGASADLNTWSTAGDTSLKEVTFPDTLGPVEWADLTFTFTRSEDDTTTGPTWLGYQVKALPAQKNQRLIVLPVYMFDHETDRNGLPFGSRGFAWQRMKQLEDIEETRDIVLYQDLSQWADEARQVVIDDITFQQTDPPTGFDGFGGTALITLRTVT